jgi:cell wall-associated NlpC family hydrolase
MYRIRRLFFIITLFSSLSFANFFIMIDPSTNSVDLKPLKPTHNEAITQKATEYSQQAIYDELHKAEYQARKAEAAKQRIEALARAREEAKKKGLRFTLSPTQRAQLLADAKYFKGGKYVWGGTTPQGFDCSGYVQYLYKKHHINLPRTAWEQSKVGRDVDLDHLQKGDLLFFLTDKKRNIPITHVGIYIGGGKFIHAASKKRGIIISPITHGSYARTFVKAKRIMENPDDRHTASL